MNKKLLISTFLLLGLMVPNLYNCAFAENIEEATKLYNEAIDLYSQNEIDKSIEYFNDALKLKPDFYEAHYNLAQILMSLNKNDEALNSLQEISKIRPDDYENLYNLGKIYVKKGEYKKAYDNLKKIPVNSLQYDSAKNLLARIEKKQNEINLEEKIQEKRIMLDSQGKAQGVKLTDFSAPSGTAVDGRGNIFVASFIENQIYKISIYGQKTVYSKSSLIQGPIGIAVDKNDNIYVANYNANNIIKISSDNNVSIFADVKKPYCITYDKERGRLYVTEQNTNQLIKFDLQ